MTSEDWNRVKEIFLAALECENSDDDAALSKFFAEKCDGNRELQDELESLLASHRAASEFIERPAVNVSAALGDGDETEQNDLARVGVYRLVREIGRGGMGAVYLAERDDKEFNQQVAVKIVKRGLSSPELLRRFKRERQILAGLEHPLIARLLDGGATADGSPYLVMEYVDGVPLDEHCDQKRFSIDERLRLFVQVCGAVQYAHQSLVVHRDLKPSNILVTRDGGTVKLLDFGIAKLLQTDLADPALSRTLDDLRALTPEYASPEQIRGTRMTTATDVYSLGVCLYELLTGRLPFDLGSRRLEEVARIICETEPIAPSRALSECKVENSSLQANTPSTAKHETSKIRAAETNAAAFSIVNFNLLKGDLDSIVLKAMRKEPEERYSSVEQFAADIRAHLNGLPVLARRGTFKYKTGKFIKRHRVGVAASALIAFAVVAGVGATVWQAGIASAAAERAAAERDRARVAQTRAERVNNFLQEMLGSAAPENAGRDVKVVDALEVAEAKARIELAAEPEVLAAVLSTVGITYTSLTRYERAEETLRAALEIYRQLPEDEAGVAECQFRLADALLRDQKYAEAEPFVRAASESQRRRAPEANRELALSLMMLGRIAANSGSYDKADAFLQESLGLAKRSAGEESVEVLHALHELAMLHEKRHDSAGEIEIYRQILPILRLMPREKNGLTVTLTNLGMALMNRGEFAEAEANFAETLALQRELYGENNLYVANTFDAISRLRIWQKRFAEAQAIAEQAMEIQDKILPADSAMRIGALSALGESLTRQGKARQGEPFLRKALTLTRLGNEPEDWTVYNAESRLGECLMSQRRFTEAQTLIWRSADKLKEYLGEEHLLTREAFRRVVELNEKIGKPNDAND